MAGIIEALALRALIRWALRALRRILSGFVILSVGLTAIYRFVPVPFTPLMFIRGEVRKAKKRWVPIEKMSPHLVAAAVAAEDQNFVEHWGFDFEAIWDAWKDNRRGGHKRGASTISQQTAKNVFLYPARTYTRKILEAYFTVLIELLWSKRRIMEVYLNVAETGKGLYGVEAAAQAYYGKSAAELDADRAAAIVACLPAPRKWSPVRPSAEVAARIAWIKFHMRTLPPSKYVLDGN
ncbi:MAG: monofunctional biosynthetic peptidoglycan transglycosylase [Bacteroidia bacterium]|nr:monofunctional biosynthetic peptidoglycan transglycosylase [Bacteroidia bacterium]MDW8334427.1 monofunctional biosynthetic peptidoglycan transglycosylase [Bacteroidia bacterium]